MSSESTTTTLAYYARNAQAFADSTIDVEFSATQERFASLLPPGSSILDLGCGSGRDTKWFMEHGFVVTPTDGSTELCAIAQRHCGISVRHQLFQDLDDVDAFDGVWACSSILHLTKEQLADVLPKIVRALHENGVLYTSFKYGTHEGLRNGRYFTDFTEQALRVFIDDIGGLTIEQLWTTADVRPGRQDETWLNVLMRKI